MTSIEKERRKNHELRALIHFIVESARKTNKSSWTCISDTYDLIHRILRESRDLSVSQDLLNKFETNRRVIEDIYQKDQPLPKTLSAQLTQYFTRVFGAKQQPHGGMPDKDDPTHEFHVKVDSFLRDYVIKQIIDSRVVFLLVVTVIYRQLKDKPTTELREDAVRFTDLFQRIDARPDRTLSIVIYNFCQASVDAIDETDYARATLYCERAVELFKRIHSASKVKNAIRSQIEDAMRITTERLINRIQEHDESEQVRIVESLVSQVINIELAAYLMPQLVFFLIRAQKYEECLEHLERIITANDLTGDFLDYQTAITLCFEWCDSLLKAERYSRGKVDFSFIDRGKTNVRRIFDLAGRITVPDMEDDTFFNVEIEKLAVIFSHAGTLFFKTGDLDDAIKAYRKSFDIISLKHCSRNRDSVDEILDRYKDMLHHPLNSAPPEAHALIATLASEKGYDLLVDSQINKRPPGAAPVRREDMNFAAIDHPQKEMVSDLIDSVGTKLKVNFSGPFESFRTPIEQIYHHVKERMQFT